MSTEQLGAEQSSAAMPGTTGPAELPSVPDAGLRPAAAEGTVIPAPPKGAELLSYS